ncbi:MAG: type II toxin-antitoxin system RelE/ParE family toxin [Gemmatimonadota bacterium]
MEIEFDDDDLKKLYTDRTFTGGWAPAIVRGFRKVMFIVVNAPDEGDLYAMRSLNFEKLKGDREGQHSLRINKQWRLIVELRGTGKNKRIGVIEIVDYH